MTQRNTTSGPGEADIQLNIIPPKCPWMLCPHKRGIACEQSGSAFTKWCEDCPMTDTKEKPE